ncbi:MAG: ice-binding family protein [Methanoregula sp.]|nr:ice-binding family protein [Methanoregula sp.]
MSPIAATSMTGFGLIMDPSNQFSTSSLVVGRVYAADYTDPTPSTLTTAISDMEAAYTDAAGRVPDVTELGAGNIGGLTLAPGVYKWGTGVLIPTDVTLSGGPDDVWIFQIAQTLDISSGKHIILSGGAQAKNIYWQVAGQTVLETGSMFNGNILDQTAIVLNTGATLNGRALAQTAVTLDANTVTSSTVPAVLAPVASFTGTPTTGTAPLTVVFTDSSTGSPTSWSWDFGEVDITNSTDQNPVHTYASAGTYTVALIATNADGSDTATKPDYITVSVPAPVANLAPVNLGTAGNFVILTKAGITDVPTSVITGNVGTSPITGASITGLDCSEVTGTIYTVDAAGPACRVIAPVLLTAAVGDMQTAYTDAAGRTSPDHLNTGSGELGGLTLAPGLYTFTTPVTISTDVTLSGGPDDVWIFQIPGTLDISSGKQVILSGGAQAKNIYWQVAGATTLRTYSTFNGNILAATNIALQTGATLNGRALAQTAVTLDANTVTIPKF